MEDLHTKNGDSTILYLKKAPQTAPIPREDKFETFHFVNCGN